MRRISATICGAVCSAFLLASTIPAYSKVGGGFSFGNHGERQILPNRPPGFDCNKRWLGVDFVICASAQLLEAEADLETAYHAAREASGDPNQLRADQRNWSTKYGPNCGLPEKGEPLSAQALQARECVLKAINNRTAYLRSLGGGDRTLPDSSSVAGGPLSTAFASPQPARKADDPTMITEIPQDPQGLNRQRAHEIGAKWNIAPELIDDYVAHCGWSTELTRNSPPGCKDYIVGKTRHMDPFLSYHLDRAIEEVAREKYEEDSAREAAAEQKRDLDARIAQNRIQAEQDRKKAERQAELAEIQRKAEEEKQKAKEEQLNAMEEHNNELRAELAAKAPVELRNYQTRMERKILPV